MTTGGGRGGLLYIHMTNLTGVFSSVSRPSASTLASGLRLSAAAPPSASRPCLRLWWGRPSLHVVPRVALPAAQRRGWCDAPYSASPLSHTHHTLLTPLEGGGSTLAPSLRPPPATTSASDRDRRPPLPEPPPGRRCEDDAFSPPRCARHAGRRCRPAAAGTLPTLGGPPLPLSSSPLLRSSQSRLLPYQANPPARCGQGEEGCPAAAVAARHNAVAHVHKSRR